MTDLVERLREWHVWLSDAHEEAKVAVKEMREAAAEIERLRAKVDLLEKEIKVLEDGPVEL